MAEVLEKMYQALSRHFGPQHWWPGETPLEVAVGAILTQNTNWTNVEKAIRNLKAARVLTARGLRDLPAGRLAELIRPSGYFNIKAARVKNFVAWLWERYDGRLDRMAARPLAPLREEILGVKGIGPETADAILLYALEKPVFVVDAYAKRMLYRHRLIERGAGYAQVQQLFSARLPADVRRFNEYHALLVALGKEFCRPHPVCGACPLRAIRYDPVRRCRICYRFLPEPSECRRSARPAVVCRACPAG